MPILFSYGSLQELRVQVATFGRLLSGSADELPGFELASVPITDPSRAAACGKAEHLNVVATADATRDVRGMAFELTDAELAVADAYERMDSYERVAVVLASGRSAWTYVHGHKRHGRTSDAHTRN